MHCDNLARRWEKKNVDHDTKKKKEEESFFGKEKTLMFISNKHVHPHHTLEKAHALKERSTINPVHIHLLTDFLSLS